MRAVRTELGAVLVSRVLVIGLDGADWGILGPLMERGELPNLADLCERL